MVANLKKFVSRKTAAAGALIVSAGSAMAIDTQGVGTALTAAQGDALTVGGMVIGVVAAIVVVGIIIKLVNKA